jgi:hypothetical protein
MRRTPRKYTTGATFDTIGAPADRFHVVHWNTASASIGWHRTDLRAKARTGSRGDGGGAIDRNVPLYRIDQIERYRSALSDRSDDAPALCPTNFGGNRWKQQRENALAHLGTRRSC